MVGDESGLNRGCLPGGPNPAVSAAEPATSSQTSSPLDFFTGTIERTRTGPVYVGGLAVVAFAMVLLPLLYLALIACAAWGVLWHITHNTWIMTGEGGHGGIVRLILYAGPAIIGGILVFFMVKPFFARKAKAAEPITLDPAREPLLFAFVRKICGLVGASVPSRIDVDCQVNASAGLRRGLRSRDLVLTIGLPLVAGLDMRQLAGVLAHEFGHFSQGAGMRLTYIIRRINFWFARVVYERDEWDEKLDEAARGADWRIAVILHTARGCVWCTRRILWALMQAGHAISCFMLRQMEYDADSYEAKVGGSDAFAATANRLRLLNVATQAAYSDVQQSWASKRLPESLPLLIGHKVLTLPEEVRQKLAAAGESQKTRWFDTHPCDADRARAAQRLQQSGVFHQNRPAADLFAQFAELSKSVTRHQYQKEFHLEFTDQNLMSAEEILRESAASVQADALIRKFFGNVNVSLKPLLAGGDLPSIAPNEDAVGELREAQALAESLREEAEKVSAECIEQQNALVKFTTANILAVAGFKLEKPEAFGLQPYCISLSEQESAAGSLRRSAAGAIENSLRQLDPFFSALARRFTLALRFGETKTDPVEAKKIADLAAVTAAVGSELPRLHEIGAQLNAFVMLAQNRGHHSRPAQVDEVMSELAHRFKSLVSPMQERLSQFAYPFPHARGQLTVAEYARFETPADHEWARAYQDANAHVERLFALNYRLIGQVLARAEAAEASASPGVPAPPPA